MNKRHFLGLPHGILMRNSQTLSKLGRHSLVALLADGTLVVFIELRFQVQVDIAHVTREVMNAPSFIQCRKDCKEML